MFLKKLKNHFVPHEDNQYKPHLLRHQSILSFFLLIIIIELGFLAQVFIVFDKTKFLASVLPGVLTSLTNEKRYENNAGVLEKNSLLEQAAQLKANDMASRGYFSHNTPEGKTPWYWLDQVGYKYKYAGENLAVNFFESKDVAEAWMNSPSHRANIVKQVYTQIGIAVASGIYQGHDTVFVVQFFGTPQTGTNVLPSTVTDVPKQPIKTIPQTPNTNTPPVNTNIVTPNLTLANDPSKVLSETVTTLDIDNTNSDTNTNVTTENIFQNKKDVAVSFFKEMLTSPRHYTTLLFVAIMMVILLATLLFIFIKSEVRHPFVLAKSVALIAVIIVLLFVNLKISAHQTKLPLESSTASVVAS